jgi:putative transposase
VQLKGQPVSWKLDTPHKPNHKSFGLYYHIVFVTRGREPLINRKIADFLEQFFQTKCDELDVHLLEQNVLCDHVHLIVSLRPTHYIPEVLNFLKGTASHEANHHHEFANVLYWMRGYHIDTVSPRTLERAKAYVCNQYQHHPDKIPE